MVEEENAILKEKNISLILNDYNDIFSDFDPRSFSSRALSDDFLAECKKASRDKEGSIELRFLVPKKKREQKSEYEIKKRLREHFEKHYKEKEGEIKAIRNQGIRWFLLGTLLIFSETIIFELDGFFFNLLKVVLEPAGWFSFWEGLGKILIVTDEKSPERKFYKKMAEANIEFLSY